MANRRCLQALVSLYFSPISHFPNSFIHPIAGTLSPLSLQTQSNSNTLTPTESPISTSPESLRCPVPSFPRYFCSDNRINDNNDDDEADDDDETEEEEEGQSEEDVGVGNVSGKSDEEKAKEAEEIGYKVVGPLQGSDRLFKPYEPVFAVVQIGSHQFKVSNGDSIFVEKLKNCDVNDKLILNRILMLGSKAQTIIGRPILPDAAVHAVVEEHALDAKVIIFKKKRRKNYRRTKGHRQELTKLRITAIQGIEKPETTSALKTEKKALKVERTAVPA